MTFTIRHIITNEDNCCKEASEIEILKQVIKNQTKIMGALEDLNAKVAELQASVDAEQEQIAALLAVNAATVVTLTEQIAALEAAVASGVTAEQAAGVIAALEATKADIEGTVA